MGMIYLDLDNYWIVMIVSYVSVGTAALMVVLGVYERGECSYTLIESVASSGLLTTGTEAWAGWPGGTDTEVFMTVTTPTSVGDIGHMLRLPPGQKK